MNELRRLFESAILSRPIFELNIGSYGDICLTYDTPTDRIKRPDDENTGQKVLRELAQSCLVEELMIDKYGNSTDKVVYFINHVDRGMERARACIESKITHFMKANIDAKHPEKTQLFKFHEEFTDRCAIDHPYLENLVVVYKYWISGEYEDTTREQKQKRVANTLTILEGLKNRYDKKT